MTDTTIYEHIVKTIEAGDIDKAANIAEESLRKVPNDSKLHYLSGEIALLQKRYIQALESFRIASQGLPENAEVWGGICEAASSLGNYQESFEAGYRGLNLGILTPRQVTCTALSMAMLGEIEGGKSLLIAQTEEFMDGAEPWMGLGVIMMMMEKDTSRAFDYYKKAITLDPDVFEAQTGLGQIYLEWRKYSHALQHFNHALNTNPSYLPAHEGMIEALWQLGEPQECLGACKSLLQSQPLNRTANLRYGMSLFALNRNNEGEAHFRKALKQDSENVDIAIYLAGYLEQNAQFDEALKIYQQAYNNCKLPNIKEKLAMLIEQRKQHI